MSLADDYSAVLGHMTSGPKSLDDLVKLTGFSYHKLNGLVLDLRCKGRVACEMVRDKKQGKVNFYSLKLKGN